MKVFKKHIYKRVVILILLKNLFCSGETDWKIIVIDINDPLSSQINGKIHEILETLIKAKLI
jgi:inorganic pyrophosphatase